MSLPSMNLYQPQSEAEAAAMIISADAMRTPLSIVGGGTRSGLGRAAQNQATISTAGLIGITLYEPSEMVISARAGTPLSHINAVLAEKRQMLPFEPMDHRPLFGTTGEPTIGAVLAGNISGPARINRGACRDSAIGVRFINGRGEIIKGGGRVMKNVTGLDITKVMCGSYGTLGLLTEVTFKVFPVPEQATTLVLDGLDDAAAIAALSAALGSPFEPSAAAHLPAGMGASQARTLLRLENFASSIDYRTGELGKLLEAYGSLRRIEGAESNHLWQDVRDAMPLVEPHENAIWRISTKPSSAPSITKAIAAAIPQARWFYDWGGGLIWLSVPVGADAGASVIRPCLANAEGLGTKGHATLVRAPLDIRSTVPVFQPLTADLHKLTAGLKTSFDPHAILEPGRMYAGI
jgi:glycolate oxidase FAD binding subunit